MGWLSKMGPMLAILIVLAFAAVGSSTITDCDLTAKPGVINVDAGDNAFIHLNVLNLNNASQQSCVWNVTKKIDNTFLELSRVALGPNDTLSVVGFSVEGNNTSNTTLFTFTGSPLPGLIHTANFVIVTITLNISLNSTVDRTYSTTFYFKPSPIHLKKDAGLFSFPLNTNPNKISTNFDLQPDIEYSDRVILFNFTQLPKAFKLTLNEVEFNSTTPPPNFYLQSTSNLKVKLEYTPVKGDNIIVARYWLVTSSCSGSFQLGMGQDKSILYPNEDFRQQQKLTDIKCAQYFTAPDNCKFQVMIDKNISGLANPGDVLNVYATDGSLELGLNNPALMYFRTIENYLTGNRYLVVYDSPFASTPNAQFKAPFMKAIPATQASVFMLTEKDQQIQISLDGKSPVVHMLYPTDLADTKRALVQFPRISSLKSGQLSISIYNSETELSTPIVTLGQFNSLPSSIRSNTAVMRIVYFGNALTLNVTYKLVDSNSCQLLSPFDTTFEVRGGQSSPSPCSWYIPDSKSSNVTVINPTILKIPQGKALTVTTFIKEKDAIVNSYPGPISEFYFPDIFLNSANAYQFTLDSSNTSKDSLHLLIAEKSNYLTEALPIQASEKVSSISSANYPGYYPVGLTQNWMFVQDSNETEWALVTFKDIHLADAHNLSMVAKGFSALTYHNSTNLTQIPDYLVSFPFSFTLNAVTANNLRTSSNRGFKVDFQYPGIAANFSLKPNTPTHINFDLAQSVNDKPLSIYYAEVNDGSHVLSDSILRINISLPEGETFDKTKAILKVCDSISLRQSDVHHANLVNGTTNTFLGSIRTVFIIYDYSASLTTKTNFSISITVTSEKCTNSHTGTPLKCLTTDRCITDEMFCNGLNDCGDYTDELYCNGTSPIPPPTPVPTPPSGGVNTLVVLFILMPMSAILGIVGYIYLPQFLTRIRRGRYSEFRDLSEVS